MKIQKVECKQYLSITNTNGSNTHFNKNEIYYFEFLDIGSDSFCVFFYDKIYDNRYRIRESIFTEHFYTVNELRKIKLNKLKNDMSI